jgi:hypothetical protein
MATALPTLLEKLTEYSRETTDNHGQFNQVWWTRSNWIVYESC